MQGIELKTVVARVEQQVDAIVVELKAVADKSGRGPADRAPHE